MLSALRDGRCKLLHKDVSDGDLETIRAPCSPRVVRMAFTEEVLALVPAAQRPNGLVKLCWEHETKN